MINNNTETDRQKSDIDEQRDRHTLFIVNRSNICLITVDENGMNTVLIEGSSKSTVLIE